MPQHSSPPAGLWRAVACAALLTLLTLPAPAAADAVLTWLPPADPDLAGYVLYKAAPGQPFDLGTDLGFVPSDPASGQAAFDIATVVPAGDFSIAMTAYDGLGRESDLSNAIDVTIGAAPECSIAADCSDGDPCNGLETCAAGRCEPGLPLQCGASACHVGRCELGVGCVEDREPEGSLCSDGDPATFGDICSAGICAGFDCLRDSDCADADMCNGSEVCVAGRCASGVPLVCAAPGPCQQGFCDPVAGCGARALPDGTRCDDANPSTLDDQCSAGTCGGFACTADLHCDDGNACNGSETCVAGQCNPGTSLSCPDPGPCGQGVCRPDGGCGAQVFADGTACDDGDATTSDDVCRAGTCEGAPVQTTDACQDAFGAPRSIRLGLRTDAPGMHVIWNAPAHPDGAIVRFRTPDATVWSAMRGTATRVVDCQAEYRAAIPLEPFKRYLYSVSGRVERGMLFTQPLPIAARPEGGPYTVVTTTFFANNGLAHDPNHAESARVVELARQTRPLLLIGGGGYVDAASAMKLGLAATSGHAVDQWLHQLSRASGLAPFLPALGAGDAAGDLVSRLAIPTTNVAFGSYSFDFAATHFVALNTRAESLLRPSETTGGAHLDWLERDLARARERGLRWLVVYTSMDFMTSDAAVSTAEDVRSALMVIFERRGVDLVLSGGAHSYERSYPLQGLTPVSRDATTVAQGTGVVYVRSGAAGVTQFGRWASAKQPEWSAVRNNTEATVVTLYDTRFGLLVRTQGMPPEGLPHLVDSFVIR